MSILKFMTGLNEECDLLDPESSQTAEPCPDQDQEFEEKRPDAQINSDCELLYASQTFAASLEGQVCVLRGDTLQLIDDSNPYWWLVRCEKTDEIGYVPAEIVETPLERLARINKNINLTLSQFKESDLNSTLKRSSSSSNKGRVVVFDRSSIRYNVDADNYTEDDFHRRLGVAGIGKVIIGKLLTHRKKGWKFTRSSHDLKARECDEDEKGSGDDGTMESYEPLNSSTSVEDEDGSIKTISVIRVYAGNIDLKATFKTVNFDKNMTTRDLLHAALKKFKIPLSMAQYYHLGVLHMDSQEKRLKDDDVVYQVFDSLRSKHLPGVSEFTRVDSCFFHKRGSVNNVLINDDNIIRIIINKDGIARSKMILVRVFIRKCGRKQNEEDLIYKTLAVPGDCKVLEAIASSLRKFRMKREDDYLYSLYQKINGNEIHLNPDALLSSEVKQFKDPADNLFILEIKWVGDGPEPLKGDASAVDKKIARRLSIDADINNILNLRPGFLEEPSLPTTHALDCPLELSPVENTETHESSLHDPLTDEEVLKFTRYNPQKISNEKYSCNNPSYDNLREKRYNSIEDYKKDDCRKAENKDTNSSERYFAFENRDVVLEKDFDANIEWDTSEPHISSSENQLISKINHSDDLISLRSLCNDPNLYIGEDNTSLCNLDTTEEPRDGDMCQVSGPNSGLASVSLENLKPPVRKESNSVCLPKFKDENATKTTHMSFDEIKSASMDIRNKSRSFDAMEKCLEEMMSGGCQSTTLNELEFKVKMMAVDNATDS